ncbi:hypothetical protein ILYODFUR_038087 [Ilyodon furcidens]|uniref:Secreted protein n=1 Tax=Ilyodon furcidens TaxID=33524 RepID=A0ABV0VB79_9TELE
MACLHIWLCISLMCAFVIFSPIDFSTTGCPTLPDSSLQHLPRIPTKEKRGETKVFSREEGVRNKSWGRLAMTPTENKQLLSRILVSIKFSVTKRCRILVNQS